jgi:hypothetical protein
MGGVFSPRFASGSPVDLVQEEPGASLRGVAMGCASSRCVLPFARIENAIQNG